RYLTRDEQAFRARSAANLGRHLMRLPGRVLEPVERLSEILFGLIMALTITGAVSVTTADRFAIRTMLFAALGCNIALGNYRCRNVFDGSSRRARAQCVGCTRRT